MQSKDWDERKLSRVLTERAKSRSLAASAYIFTILHFNDFLLNDVWICIDLPEG